MTAGDKRILMIKKVNISRRCNNQIYIYIYIPNIGMLKYIKQVLTALKGETIMQY